MDVSPPLQLKPGWGNLYQGAAADDGVLKIEKGLWIVCMNYGEIDDTWVDHDNVVGLTVIAINDAPAAVLSDELVFAGVDQDVALLSRGIPRIAHCGAGISRASYRNLPLIMHVRQLGYDAALALLRTIRPQADPNSGFEAQHRRLEPILVGAVLP
jgi:hypothetical protein